MLQKMVKGERETLVRENRETCVREDNSIISAKREWEKVRRYLKTVSNKEKSNFNSFYWNQTVFLTSHIESDAQDWNTLHYSRRSSPSQKLSPLLFPYSFTVNEIVLCLLIILANNTRSALALIDVDLVRRERVCIEEHNVRRVQDHSFIKMQCSNKRYIQNNRMLEF